MDNSSEVTGQSKPSFWAFPVIELMGNVEEGERRDAVEHRQRILAAARLLFAEHGVEQVSMHQIAQAAHVGQGTLYRRFAHKGQLCMVLLGESVFRFQAALLAYFEQVGDTLPYFEQLYGMLMRLMDFTEENAALLNAMLDAASGGRRTQSYRSPFYMWIRAVVVVVLRRGIACKQVPEMDVEYVVDVVLSLLAVDFYRYQRHELGLSRERIAQGLRNFLLTGLGIECESGEK